MIEYKPKPNRENDFVSGSPSLISGDLPNPFPGLRPFDINEYHLFFGREGHSDQILDKLTKARFISILGYSGSGKSSLMYCGVIPILHGGFMTEAGSNWNVITTRPGTSPFKNLASSILKSNSLYNESAPDETQYRQIAIESILRGDQEGLLRALNYFKKPEKQNFLIYIDQFEELIRFKKENKSSEVQEETLNYVDLLIQTLKSTDNSVYIALSMRSEFLGECSVFRGLTNLINQSNFLVPRLSWQNRRKVIEGPVSVAGGAISNRLLNRLLEEVGDNQDQLPILQHALMRSWNYWKENRDEGESIDLRHYNAIGKMSGALSQHADEIFEELTSKQKHITEILFKLLTEKGQDNLGLRKSAMLSNVSKLSGATDEEVIEVVEAFRKPERSFLMPAYGIHLTGESLIEISHESLMRIWVRLKNWVDEEHESSQMYMRLSDASEMYQIGRTGLWRPPDLQLALNWQKKQKPNLIWARRYNEAFERTIVFLDTSRITYEAEQKSQEMQQKRLLRRTRLAAIFLAIAFIIAIAFFVFGVVQQKNAEREAALAIENETLAKENLKLANLAKLDADSARQVADQQRLLVELSAQELQDAVSKLRDANSNLINAISRESAAREEARIERDNAIQQSILAERKSHEADSASRRANENFKQAQRLLYLQVAQSMSAKSVNIEDDDLKGLLAFQAFIFNKEFEGRKYDPYIYNGLHSTLAQ
ncbi:MAG: High-affnity carbon uptake protein Hat/HatR, partial [Cyclobacteriaceae bacterium]|nr:High-affnity carbon uptake protein Hat/HatR [Cyclobacteriaceae bacterium]